MNLSFTTKIHCKSEIKGSLLEILADSTSHGLPRIIKSKHILMKLIWALCFLASTGYCSYLVVKVICDFLNYDCTTTIDTVYETPAKFPVITICNSNPFQTNYADVFLDDFLKNFKLDQNLSSSIKLFFVMSYFYDNVTMRKSIANPLNEVLINCEFNTLKCTAHDFEWMFHTTFGNCYRFNSGKDSNNNKKRLEYISLPGFFYGLKLELFVDSSNKTQNLIRQNGYHVMINNQTDNAKFAEGFDIATGMITNVVINRYYTYKLGEPYNNCRSNLNTIDAFDSDLYRGLFRFNLSYRQTDCFYFCYQKQVIEKCNCYLKAYDRLNSNVLCVNQTQYDCSQEVWIKYLKSNIFKECSPYCPAECESVSYGLTISAGDFPARGYFESNLVNNEIIKTKIGNRNITYDELKTKILAINVYYDTMTYSVTSQHPKWDIFDLASSIGGLLGLFLGISFLSLIEIVEACFEVIYIKCFKSKSLFNVKMVKPMDSKFPIN